MRLERVDGSIDNYLYLERYVGEGSQTYTPFAKYSEVSEGYRPESDTASFEVPSILIPTDQLNLYTSCLNSYLCQRFQAMDQIPFFVHPDLFLSEDQQVRFLKDTYRKGPNLTVAPSASTRTVLVTSDSQEYFLKLHLPKRISRLVRTLPDRAIHNSIEVSRDLGNIASPHFGYLPDIVGVSHKEFGWGYMIRDLIPLPTVLDRRYLIPYRALYSKDVFNPSDEPLLIQLIKHLDVDPKTFIQDEIINPQIESWCQVATQRGILMEAHGQNTLLEVNEHYQPKRVVHRDLNRFIDPTVRKAKGLGMPFQDNLVSDETFRRERYSLIYDHYLGYILLDYLAALAKSYFNIPENELQKPARDTFDANFPDFKDYFSPTAHYPSQDLDSNNLLRIVDSGQIPKWRPTF